MPIPIAILIQAKGGPQAASAVLAVANAEKAVAAEAKNAAREAKQFAAALGRVKDGAASAWSPAISAARQLAIQLKQNAVVAEQSAQAQAKAAKDAAAAESQASKQAAQAARQAAKEVEAALKATPAISLKTALQGVVNQARQIGPALKSGGVGAVLAGFTVEAKNLNIALQQVQDKRSRFSALSQGAQEARQVGGGLMLAGGAGLGLVGKTALDAGEFERMRTGLRAAMGSDKAGDDFFAKIQKFDKRSSVDLREAMQQAQAAMAQGFKPEELLNNSNTGLMDKINNAVTLAGGGTEEFGAVFRQLSQIRSKGKASMQDLNAIAEGGKINVRDMLKSSVTADRFKEINSGGGQATSDEVFGALNKGLSDPKYQKGAEDALNTLPIELDNLKSSLFQLSAAMGESVLPPIKMGVQVFTWLADSIRNLSPVTRGIITYTVLFGSGLLFLGGVILVAGGMAASAAINILAFRDSELAAAIGARVAGVSLLGLATGALAVGAAVYFAGLAFQGTADAAKMSNAELEKTYPFWSKIWGFVTLLTDGLASVFDWIASKISWVRSKLGLGGDTLDQNTFDQLVEKKLYDTEIARRKKSGGDTGETFEAWESKRKTKNDSVGGGKDGGDAAQTKADSSPSSAAPGMPDLSAVQKQISDAQSNTSGAVNASVTPNVNLSLDPSAMPTLPLPSSDLGDKLAGDDYRDLEQRNMEGDKSARAPLRKANLQRKWSREDAAAARKAEREQKKSADSAGIESGIAALGDGSADVSRIEALRADLREAHRKKNQVEAAVLSERIARAEDAARELRQQATQTRKEDGQLKKQQAENQREQTEQYRRQIQHLVSTKQITREEGTRRMDEYITAQKRGALGMGVAGGGGAALFGAPGGLLGAKRINGGNDLQRIGRLQNDSRAASLMEMAANAKNPAEAAYLARRAAALNDANVRPDGFQNRQDLTKAMRPVKAGEGAVGGNFQIQAWNAQIADAQRRGDKSSVQRLMNRRDALQVAQMSDRLSAAQYASMMQGGAIGAYRGYQGAAGALGGEEAATGATGNSGGAIPINAAFTPTAQMTPDEILITFQAEPVRIRRDVSQGRALTTRDVKGATR